MLGWVGSTIFGGAALLLAGTISLSAQQPGPQGGASAGGQGQNSQPPMAPMPDAYRLNMMIRTAIVALNQANQTGNYTVLRDLGATPFRQTNDAARLAEIFAPLRKRQLDLSPTLFFTPQLVQQPVVDPRGILRLVGYFPTAPERVNFDVYYVFESGQWRLFGVGVVTSPVEPASANAAQGAENRANAAPAPAAPASAASAKPAAKTAEKPAKAPEKPAKAAGRDNGPKPQAAVENKTTNNTVRIDLGSQNAAPQPTPTPERAQAEAAAEPEPEAKEKEEGGSFFPW